MLDLGIGVVLLDNSKKMLLCLFHTLSILSEEGVIPFVSKMKIYQHSRYPVLIDFLLRRAGLNMCSSYSRQGVNHEHSHYYYHSRCNCRLSLDLENCVIFGRLGFHSTLGFCFVT